MTSYFSGQTDRWAKIIMNVFRQERNVMLKMLGRPLVQSANEKTVRFAPKVAKELLSQEVDVESYVRAQYLISSEWGSHDSDKLLHLPYFTHLLSADAADKYRRFAATCRTVVQRWLKSDRVVLDIELDKAAAFETLDSRSQVAYALFSARDNITALSCVLFSIQYELPCPSEAVLEAAALQYIRYKKEYHIMYDNRQLPEPFWEAVARLEEEVYGKDTTADTSSPR
jgi:hypothetical protein